MARAEDITGQRFGRPTVISRAGSNRQGKSKWKCRCDCGEEIECLAVHLRSGNTKSCGPKCRLQCEQAAQRAYRHGDAVRNNVTSLYSCWIMMRQRCLNSKNKNYETYGGNYIPFRNYVNQHLGPRPSPKHSIDRKNNEGNYEPGNLKWSTPSQQRQNQRQPKIDKLVERILNAPPIEWYDAQP